jgi:hypothetical protein
MKFQKQMNPLLTCTYKLEIYRITTKNVLHNLVRLSLFKVHFLSIRQYFKSEPFLKIMHFTTRIRRRSVVSVQMLYMKIKIFFGVHRPLRGSTVYDLRGHSSYNIPYFVRCKGGLSKMLYSISCNFQKYKRAKCTNSQNSCLIEK